MFRVKELDPPTALLSSSFLHHSGSSLPLLLRVWCFGFLGFFFIFFLFIAIPVAHGNSQARVESELQWPAYAKATATAMWL